MNKYIGLIILAVIVILIIKAISKKFSNKQNHNSDYDNTSHNEYYSKINAMSYKQLDKMHDELIALVREIPSPLLPGLDDNTNLLMKEKYQNKIKERLPIEKQIYGCKTYGDAQNLNQAVVKKLDYLYDKGEYKND